MNGFTLPGMWCGVLGPLVVRNDAGQDITISGPARRLLFAALVSRAGRTVAPDVLIEDIWGTLPPRSAAKTLQSHVVRLRDDLGRTGVAERLVTDRFGYRLDVTADDVDATRFEKDVRAAMDSADPGRAMAMIETALSLWRGDPYEEFVDVAFPVAERIRLGELRQLAEEHHTDLALAAGESAALVSALEKRVADAPYRERAWEQLVLALYRAGRQADALGAYRRVRERLADELGVDPGPGLRDLESRILRQDPDLLVAAVQRRGIVTSAHPDRCPYLGLASYGDNDSDLFVGRERVTAELVGRVADHRVVVVAGASGTGKSSLVRAGLLPALRAGALPGSGAWRSAVRTPTDDIAASVASGLDLLVVDQAEELFTRLDASARAWAAELLEQLAESGARLVLVLRGDFYARLAEIQPFGAYAQAATVLVGALRADDVRRVVVEPAHRVGLECDEDFVEAVMDDVAGQPAALPLLSAALVRTWENRTDGRLTLDGYRSGGGFARALEATAEHAYGALTEDGRTAARRLLVRLAELDGEQWVRRPLRREDVEVDLGALAVLTPLAHARVVTVTPSRVELTHDALLVYWPRLRGWLADRTRAAGLLDHLGAAARAWNAAGRLPSDLYRGVRLQTALDWTAEHPEDMSETEAQFLAASSAAAEVELTEARLRADRESRGRRRLRFVVAALAAVVVVTAAAALIAVHERASARLSAARARSAALTADARRLAALSVNAPDLETSSLLAAAAYRLQDSLDTRGALLAVAERNQAALWRIAEPHRLVRIAATPDGSRVAVFDNRQRVLVIDVATRRQVASFYSEAGALDGMTADGRQVVVIGHSALVPSGPDPIAVLDAATGARVRVLVPDGNLNGPEPSMSQDASRLAVLTTVARGRGVVVDIFDAHDWAASPVTFVAEQPVALAAGNRDVAVELADGTVEVHDDHTGALVRRLPARGAAPGPKANLPLAIAPDGSRVAVTDAADPRKLMVESVTGTGMQQLPPQPDSVTTVGFAPDGRQVAVTSDSGSVAVYSSTDGSQTESLPGHSGAAIALAWTGRDQPTGLYTVGLDSELVSWSVGTLPALVSQRGPDVDVPDRGEPFGHYVLGLTPQQSGDNSRVDLYLADLETGHLDAWPLHLRADEYVNQAVATPDGRLALISVENAANDNRMEVWDLIRHVRLRVLALPAGTQQFVLGLNGALSPDGRVAYVSLGRTRVGVFDVASGRYLRDFSVAFAQPNSSRILVVPWLFAPDGQLLVGAYDPGPLPTSSIFSLGVGDGKPPNQRLGLVDPASGRLLAQVALGDINSVSAAAWSHDGSLLAVGSLDGTVTLHDAATLAVRGSAGTIEAGYVHSVYFAPDDRALVVTGTSSVISVLSVPDLTRQGTRVELSSGTGSGGVYAWYDHSGAIVGLAPDVNKPGGSAERWFRFPVAPRALLAAACSLAGTDISPTQWSRYVGDRPYQHVCSG